MTLDEYRKEAKRLYGWLGNRLARSAKRNLEAHPLNYESRKDVFTELLEEKEIITNGDVAFGPTQQMTKQPEFEDLITNTGKTYVFRFDNMKTDYRILRMWAQKARDSYVCMYENSGITCEIDLEARATYLEPKGDHIMIGGEQFGDILRLMKDIGLDEMTINTSKNMSAWIELPGDLIYLTMLWSDD